MEPPAKRSSRRLLFDRRYGWVVDEWKDPSEEALSGGRGMFCVVPLGKTLFQTASQSCCAMAFKDHKLYGFANDGAIRISDFPGELPRKAPETDL